jgi:hypothetical protein
LMTLCRSVLGKSRNPKKLPFDFKIRIELRAFGILIGAYT